MKRFIKHSTLMLAAGLCLLASCADKSVTDNPVEPPVIPETDYTVMFYTVGGGNLDISIEGDLLAAAKTLKADSKQVRFIVQYKYSKPEGMAASGGTYSGRPSHVYRYELTPDMADGTAGHTLLKLTDDQLYGNQHATAQFHQPDSLANFIRYCQKVAPAKNYILMMSNHGGGYNIMQDYDKVLANAAREGATTRSILADDNTSLAMSVKEVREGIEKGGAPLKLMYFDCCLMNTMEGISELIGLTDYVLASGHTVMRCDYATLTKLLYETGADGDFAQAMGRYADACAQANANFYNEFFNPTAKYVDWAVTDMKKFPAVLTALKDYVDFICEKVPDFESDVDFDEPASKCYQYYPRLPLYDLLDYCQLLGAYPFKLYPERQQLFDRLYDAVKDAQVAHAYVANTTQTGQHDLSYSVTLGGKGFIPYTGVEGNPYLVNGICDDGSMARCDIFTNTITTVREPTPALAWANSYNLLAFDQLTGWSRWLKQNPAIPFNNPPYDNADDALEGEEAPKKMLLASVRCELKANQPSIDAFDCSGLLKAGKLTSPIFLLMPDIGTGTMIQNIKLPGKVELTLNYEKNDITGPWQLHREGRLLIAVNDTNDNLIQEKEISLNFDLKGNDAATELDDAAKKGQLNLTIEIDEKGNIKQAN